ncbi:MAG: helix-turn-helix domain-containing protein [Coriobacteriia bacterium]|nr:helix-turn-helix domain-containing protein [Coriobacteriia bacterium]MCL2750215.1 helix-turn-helix domain-containing protein [Coriobacteriia bacterium]
MDSIADTELEIGKAIRQARIRKGLTLDDTAARANLSPTAVRSLELGRGSTLSTMLKVLSVIGETRLFTEWIESSRKFSPVAQFRETQKKAAYPQRVGRKRSGTRDSMEA